MVPKPGHPRPLSEDCRKQAILPGGGKPRFWRSIGVSLNLGHCMQLKGRSHPPLDSKLEKLLV